MAGAGRRHARGRRLGDKYVVKPLNLNTRVDEADQVDTLNVFNGDSPADDTGTLTATQLSGLGMGTRHSRSPAGRSRRHHTTPTSRSLEHRARHAATTT